MTRYLWPLVVLLLATGCSHRVTVPSVVGLDLEHARSRISDQGLNFQPRQVYSEDKPEGVAIGQVPSAGSMSARGATVFVDVSQGPQRVVVPSFQGLSLAQARTLADSHSLVLRVEGPDTAADGSVGSQNPPAGAKVAPNTPVIVTLGRGGAADRREVPELQGQTVEDATRLLARQNLKLEVLRREPSAQIPAGGVVSQVPVAGTAVAAGTAVRVVISRGKDLATAPNLVGKTLSEARDVAAPLSLHLVVTGAVRSDDAQVTRQDPAAGKPLAQPTISVVLEETAAVPAVIGRTEDEARRALEKSGLTVGEIQRVHGDGPAGTVLDQDPAGGIETLKGSAVKLTIAD